MLFVTLIGASGAVAETGTEPVAQVAPPVAEVEPAAADAPRFYAEEVAQPLPETKTSDAASLSELVATMPVDAALSSDMQCLAEAIYFEARGEPLEGQLAVAKVVINRANSGLYPSDYCSVVTQPAQFSFVRRGVIPEADEGSDAWRRAMAIAQIAEDGLWECKARDALYFHATYVRPKWASAKTQLARIDTHIFYR